MIEDKKYLQLFIREDVKANGIKLGFSYYVKLFYGNINARAFRYLKSLRKYEYSINTHGLLLFWRRFYNRRLGAKYNIAITPNIAGYGLKLPHLEQGVIINCESMGNYCVVNSGVVLGNKGLGKSEERPIIGSSVNFCVGCKVIGRIMIGDNVIVAPNAVVVKDVPANSIVAGIPATVIKSLSEKNI